MRKGDNKNRSNCTNLTHSPREVLNEVHRCWIMSSESFCWSCTADLMELVVSTLIHCLSPKSPQMLMNVQWGILLICHCRTSSANTETSTNVEKYPMSNSADLSLWACGGIGGEHPTSIQLSKAVDSSAGGRDTPETAQLTTDLGCGVHPSSERAQAGL